MLRVVETGVVYDDSPAVIAGVCRCANGDLLVSYNSSGDLSPGQTIGIVRSTDGGKTWGQPEVIFESVFKDGGVEAGCSLTCLSNGRVLLPYADGYYLYPETDTRLRRALLFCPYSDDHGKTWRNTKAQHYEGLEAFTFGRVIELPSGDLLLPLWGAYDRPGVWIPATLRSSDGGETWGHWHPIAPHGNETPITLLPDGRLLALIRQYNDDPACPFYITYSSDGGETWSIPQWVNLFGTAPSLHVTPDGRLLAGYRATCKDGCCHVASSRDGGRCWHSELELCPPRGEWSYGGYPVLEDLPGGRLIATFHNGRPPTSHVAYNVLEWA